jgi:hypothetical protein
MEIFMIDKIKTLWLCIIKHFSSNNIRMLNNRIYNKKLLKEYIYKYHKNLNKNFGEINHPN